MAVSPRLPKRSSAKSPQQLDLHPEAQRELEAQTTRFATSLLLGAQCCAYAEKADVVLTSHVQASLSMLRKSQNRSWTNELSLIFGSAFIGGFIQGMVTELGADPIRRGMVTLYLLMGVLGGFLTVFGLWRSRA